jgi:hypothetical protein
MRAKGGRKAGGERCNGWITAKLETGKARFTGGFKEIEWSTELDESHRLRFCDHHHQLLRRNEGAGEKGLHHVLRRQQELSWLILRNM